MNSKQEKVFKVGDTFRHRDSSVVLQYHDRGFEDLIFDLKDLVLPIGFSSALSQYEQSCFMTHTKIQETTKSISITEKDFLQILYLLIIRPDLGKNLLKYELSKRKIYFFHVILNSQKPAVATVSWWDGQGWRIDISDWSRTPSTYTDRILLFPSES